MPLFHTDHKSPNHQEWINVRIHGELLIFQPNRDVLKFSNETGKRQLRNEFNFSNVHGIMNTSGLVQSK